MENISIPTMLSIKETAKRTGISATFIRNLCRNNKIIFIKSGNKYLVNLERFVSYLNQQ